MLWMCEFTSCEMAVPKQRFAVRRCLRVGYSEYIVLRRRLQPEPYMPKASRGLWMETTVLAYFAKLRTKSARGHDEIKRATQDSRCSSWVGSHCAGRDPAGV